ncbi:MAG TPA: methyltransferase domain-containing protein [Pseudonocardiaceae bacterium]|nr:methyltransferase domain-containing protein [Pseudonocardiaceae bacterium]
MIINTAQAEAWNGYEGEHWAAHDDRYDAMNGGFNPFLLDGIGERDRVLDIGCGNGQLTRQAARKAGSGRAVGIDLSGPMLARARARTVAENLGNVTFEQGDAQVHTFAPGGFDVAVSRLGVMFFADPVAAFANIRGALRPAGRLAFVCFKAFAGTDMGTVFDGMTPFVPRPTGPDGTGPTSFADPARILDVLTGAGFVDVAWTHIEADQDVGRDVADAAAFLGAWGPIRYHLSRAAPDVAALARDALANGLRAFVTPDGVRLRGRAWLVTAARPT